MKFEIEVPDGIVGFLKQVVQYDDDEIRKWIEDQVQDGFGADWNVFEGCADVFFDLEKIIDKFDLRSTKILRNHIKDC